MSEPTWTTRTPWLPDHSSALLALNLLERYHAIAQDLKVLLEEMAVYRKMGTFTLPAATIEAHRVQATGLFNHLCRMLFAGLLSPELFTFVIDRRAAKLWLEHVAPLDHAIRKAAAEREGRQALGLGETVIEVFYQRYADTGELAMPVSEAKAPVMAH